MKPLRIAVLGAGIGGCDRILIRGGRCAFGYCRLLTPMFQSSSIVIPWLRDTFLAPAAKVWPMPRLLTALVSGDLLRPIRD